MGVPRRVFSFKMMYQILQAITDKVRRASEQEERGEEVTACGMSGEEIADLCEDFLPSLFDPYMTMGEIKRETGLSESTINRAIRDGELKGEKRAGDHFHLFKKWNVRQWARNRIKKKNK